MALDGGFRYQRTYINEYGAFNIEGSASGFGKVPSITNMWDAPQISGSFGATWVLNDQFVLRSNFLTGTIEPRSGTLTVDLTEPENEHRTMIDAGLQMNQEGIGEVSLGYFYIRQSDAIVLSGQTATLNGRIMELYLNRDQSTKGMEFEFKTHPLLEKINFLFNLSVMNHLARVDGSMQRDIEKPRVILSSGIMGKQWQLDYNFFWKYVSGYESRRFTSSYQPLGDFNTFNLTIGHPLGNYESTRVYLELTNLTDNHYSTVVGYPDYGRSFQLGIRQNF